jgi:HupE / UreJ protein
MRKLWVSVVLSMTMAFTAAAHEVRPAVADIAVGADKVDLTIRFPVEPLIAGMSLQGLEDTNDSPLSAQYDALRADDPAALEAALRQAWPEIGRGMTVQVGDTVVPLDIVSVTVPEVGDVTLPRDSVLTLQAVLPVGGADVRFGWDAAYGSVIVRQVGGGEDAYSAILQNGDLSAPLPRESVAVEGAWPVFLRFIISGFEHIVPKGLDHILFVLGLFFFALRTGPLLAQVTAFTVAHTVTLALASLKIITLPASVVEPLIAASIVYVAAENIIGGRVGWLRVGVVFGFGLLHGLGFASVLDEVGLQEGRFVVGLIGFNIGVELGQLAVIAVALLLLGLPFGGKPWYRARVAVPASLAIAAVGAWWTVERVFLG